jgi:hypothetical protein
MSIQHNHYQGTVEDMAQLEVATCSDCDTVATLTAINAKLTLQLETLQAYTHNLKEAIVQLKLKIKPA